MNTIRLVKAQIGVAVLAVAVTGISLYQLTPLTKKLAAVEGEIISLEVKRGELQRINDDLARSAKPIDNPSGKMEAWLYVGRASSSGQWAPLSEGVVPSPNSSAVRGFSAVTIKKNATLVDDIEGTTQPSTGGKSTAPVRLVKAGNELRVLDSKVQPSVGGGSFIWVKVSIPSDQLLEIASR